MMMTISGSVPSSKIHVVIDIIDVMPEPAKMKKHFSAACSRCVKKPEGPSVRVCIALSFISCVLNEDR